MALNSLFCADVPLSNYSHSLVLIQQERSQKSTWYYTCLLETWPDVYCGVPVSATLWKLVAEVSGSTLACGARGLGIVLRCGKKYMFSRKSQRYAALGTGCTLTAVPMLTQPSTLRGTVNKYQQYGWVLIQMAMGKCSVYSILQADSEVKFAAWPTSWRWPTVVQMTQSELSHMAGAV